MSETEEPLKNNDIGTSAPPGDVAEKPVAVSQAVHDQHLEHHAESKKAVRFLNYFGIGWLLNSTASLYITYNVLPTKGAQAAIGKLKNGIHTVMSNAIKLTNGGKTPTGGQLKYTGDKARSAAEILCMCISGTLLLVPMGLIARREETLAARFDRWWNKDFYDAHPEAVQESLDKEKPKQDPVSWGQMGLARVAGIGTNLTVDQMIEAYNNHRHALGKSNFDTAEWRIGNIAYDQLSPDTRDRMINFFSRHKAGIDNIQPSIQERLSHVVGHDPKRMVFAEQSRLFLKEFVLTLLLAGVVYKVCNMKLFHPKRHEEQAVIADAKMPLVTEDLSEPSENADRHSARAAKAPGWKQHLDHKAAQYTDLATHDTVMQRT